MTERFAASRSTRSARATAALGERLGRLLRPGDVVALVGELGAGKTRLVRGACAGASVPPAEVSSPSFAIVATYHGRIPIHHADLYRIADEDELYATGFFDLVGGDGALLVEWADRVRGALPPERLELRLRHDERAPSTRHLEIEGTGARHAALARDLVAASRPRRSTKRKRGPNAATAPPRRGAGPGRSPRRPGPTQQLDAARSKMSPQRPKPRSKRAARSTSRPRTVARPRSRPGPGPRSGRRSGTRARRRPGRRPR